MTITNPSKYPMKVTIMHDIHPMSPKYPVGIKEVKMVAILDEPITLSKCQSIAQSITNYYGVSPSSFSIHLCDNDWWQENVSKVLIEQGECARTPEYPTKKAYYNVKKNCLQIWENDMPIYENDNGIICRDADALADCLM